MYLTFVFLISDFYPKFFIGQSSFNSFQSPINTDLYSKVVIPYTRLTVSAVVGLYSAKTGILCINLNYI